jgi:type 1 glutamine amidotransferase
MPRKIMVLLGGAYHDFDGYQKATVPLLTAAGYDPVPTYYQEMLSTLDDSYDAIVVYTSLGGAKDPKGNQGVDLNAAQAAALENYVASGGGLLGMHCATVMGESGSALHKLYGGRFIEHPPMFRFSVSPMRLPHPVTEGVEEFTVYDEFYIQDLTADSLVLMTAHDRGVCHPMVWVRTEGAGKVACIAPGHDRNAWDLPEFQRLTLQGLEWVISE